MKKIHSILRILLCLSIIINQLSIIHVNAQSPQLWGMVPAGAFHNEGELFKLNPDGTGCTGVYSFGSGGGGNPDGNLMQANNGLLYGLIPFGGNSSCGVLFSFDAVNSIYTKVYDLQCSDGQSPYGSVMQASNGKLYGMTYSGGQSGEGVLFSYDIANNLYTDLIDLNDSTGATPQRNNLMQASNGKLYGMTPNGGYNNAGVIFSYDSSGIFTKLFEFGTTNMANPRGTLAEANNHLLYGVANGGNFGKGVIFSFNPANNVFSTLFHFSDSLATGTTGTCSLMKANNGKLYGLGAGGTGNWGTIFSFDIATDSFTKVYNFDSIYGKIPKGSLMQASNGLLYGTTSAGGFYDLGVIFNFDPDSLTYLNIFDCDSNTVGINPVGDLIEVSSPSAIKNVANEIAVNIFPNPGSGFFQLTSNSTITEIKVNDLLGQLISESKPLHKTAAIDIKDKGLYFVTITSNNNSVTKKLVVQ